MAAVNGENRSVQSGTRKTIQYLHLLLNREGGKPILHTSHAFHLTRWSRFWSAFAVMWMPPPAAAEHYRLCRAWTGEIVTPEMAITITGRTTCGTVCVFTKR